MPVPDVAIIGAGPIGASTAHRLAERACVGSVVLIDDAGSVAAGKALDIRQSGPVQRFDTRVDGATDALAATTAPVVVIADASAAGAWQGEGGLALVRQLVRAGTKATVVFACPSQVLLMEACYRELHVSANRLVGSAHGAVVSRVRALAGLELGLAAVDLSVVGRPPKLVIGWSAASVNGSLLTDCVAAHRLLAISDALPKLSPPGPYAIASATAGIVEALVTGSRRRHHALTILEGDPGTRGSAVLLPLDLGRGRVLGHVIPSLSPQERTEMINGVAG